MAGLRGRLTYANVVATLALFIALTGGVVWAADKITSRDIAPDAVKSRHIKDGAVNAAELGPNSVGTTSLQDAAITETKLAPNSVGPKPLQGNSVGFDQLAPLSVDSDKVKDGSLRYGDLDPAGVSPRLFAHVSSSGVLGEQSGVESAGRAAKGQYFVRFNRGLRGCVGVASVGFGFGPGVIGAGATAQVRMNLDNDPSNVGVTIYRKGYTFNDVEDDDFHLIVAC